MGEGRREHTDTRTFRREAGKAPVLGSLTTLDVTAKQLIAVTGILIAVYFHAVAFGELRARVSALTQVLYLAPTALLLASLVFSLLVFFPDHALRGRLLVRLASLFLALGVVASALAAVMYLRG
jgi:hypothetical protein